MSDAENRGVNGSDLGGEMDNICRDFLRNVCRRGKRCKYRHPEPSESKDMGRKPDLVFCHDFQNKECRRINCKFIHCTRSEEEYYHMTGEMPPHVQEALGIGLGGGLGGGGISERRSGLGGGIGGGGLMGGSGGGGLGGGGPGDNSDIPICKDYQKGDCRRGGRCKFRHISPNDYDMEMGRGGLGSNGGGGGNGGQLRRYDSFNSMFNAGGGGGGLGGGLGGGGGNGGNGGNGGGNGGGLYDNFEYYEPERKRRMYGHGDMGMGTGPSQPMPPSHGMGPSRQPALIPPPALPSDYYILEEENAFLRRRVDELKKQVSDLTATNEFLLDQNAQLRLGGKQSGGPPIAPVAPPVQVSSGQMAQMTQLKVDGLGVAVPQAAMQDLSAAAPIAPIAPVSMAPVSMAQALPAATLVQSIPNPLVSYPIMTQGMRPSLTPSSLAH